jgi:hypothetical protein
MKVRTNKELLQLMLNNIYKLGWSTFIDGLCLLRFNLFNNGFINDKEDYKIKRYMSKNLPEHIKGTYCWERGLVKPRRQWLEEQIQKLETKKKKLA